MGNGDHFPAVFTVSPGKKDQDDRGLWQQSDAPRTSLQGLELARLPALWSSEIHPHIHLETTLPKGWELSHFL